MLDKTPDQTCAPRQRVSARAAVSFRQERDPGSFRQERDPGSFRQERDQNSIRQERDQNSIRQERDQNSLRQEHGQTEAPQGRKTVLDRLAQQGSAKAMLPRVHRRDPEVVFLNTAGGLTGGDRIAFEVDVAPGCRAVATSQTAERAYASLGETGPAHMTVRLRVGDGARLDWLPQETILFDRSALHRRTEIALEGDAACLFCETVVLGRAAMGEVVQTLDFADWRQVTRDGVPVLLEPFRLTTHMLSQAKQPAMLSGAQALCTVALIAPGAEDHLTRIRPHLDQTGIDAAASGWDGKLVIRALAQDAYPLRRWLHRLLTELRGEDLPRVWTL